MSTTARQVPNHEKAFGKEGHFFVNLPCCTIRSCRHRSLCKACWTEWPYRLTEAMSTEIEQVAATSAHHTSKTLYIGGGVPLALLFEHFESLIAPFRHRFCWQENAEWTLEASISQLKDQNSLCKLRHLGFNRLNIGFYDQQELAEDLKSLCQSLSRMRANGFALSLELLFRQSEPTPHQEKMLDLVGCPAIDHFSINLEYPQSDRPAQYANAFVREVWRKAHARAQQHGFLAYQHSHWGRASAVGGQNLAVYQGAAFRGIGPGAASSDGERLRYQHPELPGEYITGMAHGLTRQRMDCLTPTQAHAENIMRALHLPSGFDPKELHLSLPPGEARTAARKIDRWKRNGFLLPVENGHLALNPAGKWALDDIIEDLYGR